MVYASQFSGFTVGVTWGANAAWGQKFDHTNFLNNTQDLVFSNSSGGGAENVMFDHCVFGSFSIGMVANDIQVSGTQQFEAKFIASSFDGAQINLSNPAGHLFLDSPHHEAPAANTTNDYLIQSNGIVEEISPTYIYGFSSGSVPTEFVTLSGPGSYFATGVNMFSKQTMANGYAISGAINFHVLGWEATTAITSDVNGSTTGSFFSCITKGNACRIAPPSGGSFTLDAILQSTSGQIPINALTRQKQTISDQGVACTNGELSLSAGWQLTGSATVTNVNGGGQTCAWTITTGTTTGANPTITDNLTNPLPNLNTVCWMNIYGGTHTPVAGEAFRQTIITTNSPVFTANFTPTAGGTTYLITRGCGP
jgi:hypothetical protein